MYDPTLRGKCHEMSLALTQSNPDLTLVRGHYYCPLSNRKEEHWWCENTDGSIIDPTKNQFESLGHGDYIPFNGILNCAECNKPLTEEKAEWAGYYPVCSTKCHLKLVGIDDIFKKTC